MASFDELAPNKGVDTLKPHDSWVIIPEGGSSQVFLREGDGYSIAVKSEGGRVGWTEVPRSPKPLEQDTVAAAALRGKNDRHLKFTAAKTGLGRIHATKGRLATSIGFSVHPRKTHKIAFFFLQDQTTEGTKSRTTFSKGDATGWVKDLNAVFGSQANIFFDLTKADPLPLAGLSPVVSDTDAPLLARHKDGALINVYLAGNQIRSSEHDYPLGFYSIKENLIVVKDQRAPAAKSQAMLKTIAHEIAHLLNYQRKVPTAGHDYYKECGYSSDVLNTMEGANIKIPHQRVLDWNPW